MDTVWTFENQLICCMDPLLFYTAKNSHLILLAKLRLECAASSQCSRLLLNNGIQSILCLGFSNSFDKYKSISLPTVETTDCLALLKHCDSFTSSVQANPRAWYCLADCFLRHIWIVLFSSKKTFYKMLMPGAEIGIAVLITMVNTYLLVNFCLCVYLLRINILSVHFLSK